MTPDDGWTDRVKGTPGPPIRKRVPAGPDFSQNLIGPETYFLVCFTRKELPAGGRFQKLTPVKSRTMSATDGRGFLPFGT